MLLLKGKACGGVPLFQGLRTPHHGGRGVFYAGAYVLDPATRNTR